MSESAQGESAIWSNIEIFSENFKNISQGVRGWSPPQLRPVQSPTMILARRARLVLNLFFTSSQPAGKKERIEEIISAARGERDQESRELLKSE